jgi:GNAT superfamily N-acetyltransferase
VYVTALELQRHLKMYLDLAYTGTQLTVIRRSEVVARIVPPDTVKVMPTTVEALLKLGDGRTVIFRQFGVYEDSTPVQKLKPIRIEFYGDNPASYFANYEGEFWVADIDRQIVAYGGWRPNWDKPGQAALEHLEVADDYEIAGVGDRLVELLGQRAERRGLKINITIGEEL